jgi:hypothetical protein
LVDFTPPYQYPGPIDWSTEIAGNDEINAVSAILDEVISDEPDQPMENHALASSPSPTSIPPSIFSTSIIVPLKDFVREASAPPLQDKRKTKKPKTSNPQILDYAITTRSQTQNQKQQQTAASAPIKDTSTTKTKKAQQKNTPPSEDTAMSDIDAEDSMEGDSPT